MIQTPDLDLLLEADHAERLGDRSAAASKLRAYLALHAHGGDGDGDRDGHGAVRLRLGRLLVALSEPASARQVLAPLDHSEDQALATQANRLLATLDDSEGALTSAQIRWERVLADDIDDPEAHERLRSFRPHPDDTRWPSDLSLGTLVSPEGVRMSRFRLIRELGRGATAAVYLVHDERLGLPLALKVLHPQLAAASRAHAREKFFAEARLVARLRHPGVVAIYSVDEAARCLAMELVEGGTVRDRLRAVGTRNRQENAGAASGIDAVEVLATARSLLDALAYVHGAGIVHGDLKPGNILLRGPADIVLADFGVAEFAAVAAFDERPAGTPLYLAPEQFRGAPPSPATDLFAVGAILWELALGHPARRHSDLLSAADRIEAGAVPIETLAALGDLAPRLTSLIAALMSIDPRQRPPSASAARTALA
jgi:hypothetical protein